MVKQEDFKTCSQSSFCTRHRAIADLIGLGQKPSPLEWKSETAEFLENKITAELTSNEFKEIPLQAEFYILKGNSVRFKLSEKQAIYPRYEFPFGFESEPEIVSYNKVITKSGKIQISFENKNLLEITISPFSFEFFVDSVPAISFNSKEFLFYEPYRTSENLKPPPFAYVPPTEQAPPVVTADGKNETAAGNSPTKPEVVLSDQEKKYLDLKKLVGAGLGADDFKGKTDSKPRGAASIGMDISFPGTKHVFGLPEHATSFSLKPTRGKDAPYSEPYRLYNLDVFEYILDSPMALYGAVPFMLSHKVGLSTGVLWLNSAEMWVDVEKEGSDTSTHWMGESGLVDLFFFLGPTQQDVFDAFTKLTGRPQLPQKFAIAYHQCRWNYNTEQDATDVDEKFDENAIPYDVLWLDIEHTNGKRYFTWDYQKFPTPKVMQKQLSDKGRRMVTIIDPHIKKDSSYYVSSKASELDIFIKNKDGSVYDGWCWPGDSNWLDYTNPKAREYWAQQFEFSNYKDSTPSLYTWNDMNEPAIFTGPEATMPKDCIHFENVEHRDIHNGYGMLQHRSTFEGHLKRSNGLDRPFILSRAFFIGTQRYGAIWTGDNTAEWGHLAESVPMLLSIGIAGITFAGADVGGFFKNPDAELMVRWYQVGSLQPFFRAHAHIETKRREPWLFGEPYTSLFRSAVERRYKLLPYLYSLFQESNQKGYPIMRSMMQEFPDNEETFTIDDQYMLGSAILVKPVTSQGQATVSVYLPQSAKWYNYETFFPVSVSGNSKHVFDSSSLEKFPVFLRGGYIVPRKDRIRRSSDLTVNDPFSLYIALDSNNKAHGSIYIDDGSSFGYKKGHYLKSEFKFEGNVLTSKPIQVNDIKVDSAVKKPYNTRIERIVIIGMDKEPKSIKFGTLKLWFVTRKSGENEYIVTIKNPNMMIGDAFSLTVVS